VLGDIVERSAHNYHLLPYSGLTSSPWKSRT
jgi:hypothetical protein